MGYPMTYWRVLWRNELTGDYQHTGNTYGREDGRGLIRGDLRRLEQDQRDKHHLREYASHAGITPEQAKAVLDLFFDGYEWDIANRMMVEKRRAGVLGSTEAEGARPGIGLDSRDQRVPGGGS